MRTETRDLNCKLTTTEFDQKRHECVSAASAVQAREAEKKHAVSRYGNALKEAQEKLGKLIKVCETGQEVKPVTCEWRPDFAAGVRRLLRLDTLEEVDVRTLTESERQQQLELDEPAPFDDEAAEDEEPDESFVEGVEPDVFQKEGVRHVSPDAGEDFGAAVSEATK